MRGMAVRAAALVCVTTVASSALAAQRSSTAGGRGGAGARADGPVAAVAAPAGAPVASATPGTASAGSSFVEVRETFLPIDEVLRTKEQLDAKDQAANAAGTAKRGFHLPPNHKIEAAEAVLKRQARAQASPTRTVIVVMGSESDRDKALASLDGVQRRILFMFVNTNGRSETYDNTALKAPLLGFVRSVNNLWVYLPAKARAADDAPSSMFSTKLATRAMWTTMFVADGDAQPFAGGTTKAPSAATPPTAPAAALVATSSRSEPPPTRDGGLEAGFRVDDLVVARIPGVKLLGQPSDDAKVLGTLARAEEVVVTAAASGAFTKVQSAAAEGWVKTSLLAKSTH